MKLYQLINLYNKKIKDTLYAIYCDWDPVSLNDFKGIPSGLTEEVEFNFFSYMYKLHKIFRDALFKFFLEVLSDRKILYSKNNDIKSLQMSFIIFDYEKNLDEKTLVARYVSDKIITLIGFDDFDEEDLERLDNIYPKSTFNFLRLEENLEDLNPKFLRSILKTSVSKKNFAETDSFLKDFDSISSNFIYFLKEDLLKPTSKYFA